MASRAEALQERGLQTIIGGIGQLAKQDLNRRQRALQGMKFEENLRKQGYKVTPEQSQRIAELAGKLDAPGLSKLFGEIRGKGLLGSIVFKRTVPQKKIEMLTEFALKNGLILFGNNRLRDNLIWLCPPLIITKNEIDFALEIINKAFQSIFKK